MTTSFPSEEVKSVLRRDLERVADENTVLRPAWEPLLDSLRIVGIVLALQKSFGFKLPPDKVIKKGGYFTIDEAVADMHDRIEALRSKGNE